MIKAEKGSILWEGEMETLLTEASAILTALYVNAREAMGEETAKELIGGMADAATSGEAASLMRDVGKEGTE